MRGISRSPRRASRRDRSRTGCPTCWGDRRKRGPAPGAFRALLRREEVHAGLVCINVAPGLMSLDVQKRLFALALDRLGDREPINELLEITLDEHRIVHVERYDFPAGR
jgi:hypothetical protein